MYGIHGGGPGYLIPGGELVHGGEATYHRCGAHIHGGLVSFGGVPGLGVRGRPRGCAPLAPIQPGPPPKLACWLARPPCMWAAHHVWLPRHVFGFPTMYFDQGYQVSCIRVVKQNRVANRGIKNAPRRWHKDPRLFPGFSPPGNM